MRVKSIIILVIFITTGIIYYYLVEDGTVQRVSVLRVIDGDTIETGSGLKIRLKGINTPERDMPFYFEAKNFLNESVFGKKIEIKHYGSDRYNRLLAHVFLDGRHINKEIVKEGFGTLYYYEHDEYYSEINKAEEFARDNQKGIWKESYDFGCISMINLKYEEDSKRCSNEEVLEIRNSCDKDLSVIIKDDATHIYEEIIGANSLFRENYSCIWNNDGDSIYIWDSEGGLLLFYRY
jgi:endonuclease YncB( thermonuclease family)